MPKDTLKKSNQKSKPKKETFRIVKLKQELLKQEALSRINKSQDYLQHLKPELETAFTNKWPDPSQKDFDRKYVIEFARANAYKEIFNKLATADHMIEAITKQIAEPEKNYEI